MFANDGHTEQRSSGPKGTIVRYVISLPQSCLGDGDGQLPCRRNTGWFRHSHRQCAETYCRSLAQMVELVAQVAERPDFSRHRMLQALAGPAQERYVPDQDLPAVVAAGWHLSSMNRMVDHIPTRVEATQWREFQDTHFTVPEALGEDHTSTLIAATVSAALAIRNQARRLERLFALMERSSLSEQASRELLLEVWERAVALLLEDKGIDMDHEAALLR